MFLNKSYNKSFLSIENETFHFIISKQLVKHVFPFQAEFYKKRKNTLRRVRKKSKWSILKRRKKEERARNGSTNPKKKEIRRKIIKWLKKAGSQNRV